MKYRKRPVIIDAWQFKATWHDLNPYSNEGFKAVYKRKVPTPTVEQFSSDDPLAPSQYPSEIQYFIHTLEGEHRVIENDYIIKGVKGEFYPCKEEIFQLTYEKVD